MFDDPLDHVRGLVPPADAGSATGQNGIDVLRGQERTQERFEFIGIVLDDLVVSDGVLGGQEKLTDFLAAFVGRLGSRVADGDDRAEAIRVAAFFWCWS